MIISLNDLKAAREKHREQKVVLGGGAFDILHQGHIDYLRDIRKLGDILVIAVKSDAEIKSYKEAGRPIQNEDVRAAIVDAIRYVDYVLIAPEPEGQEFPRMAVARALKPDILVSISDKWRAYEATLKAQGTALKILPIEKVNSTTSIIERIRNRPDA
jgi:D-beta-D-heptose 7-phosphate kinase/D-beta-D-heptose 1-phosphate adenosyltransferase